MVCSMTVCPGRTTAWAALHGLLVNLTHSELEAPGPTGGGSRVAEAGLYEGFKLGGG